MLESRSGAFSAVELLRSNGVKEADIQGQFDVTRVQGVQRAIRINQQCNTSTGPIHLFTHRSLIPSSTNFDFSMTPL